MNTVLSLIILLTQNSLKKDINYNIAIYILEHIYDLKDMGIKELAEACYTSTTSILKFCKVIGYDSYSEFKRQFVSNIEIRKVQLKTKLANLTEEDLLNKLQYFSNEVIDKDVLLRAINECILVIQKTKKIYLYGATFPIALSQSFIEDMAMLGVSCQVVQMSRGNQEIEKNNGLHMIISLSGRFIEINRNEYMKIINQNENSVLLSRKEDQSAKIYLPIPHTSSSEYDEITLLLIYDLLKYKYSVS